MKVSIIVPIYNVETYLRRCIDSILSQTYPNFELILVDDGSPDNSGAICDEYAAKDPRVVVLHKENGGQASARNLGLEWAFANSDSEWITFVDSDDWVHPQMLECLLNNAVKHNVKLSMCSFSEEMQVTHLNDFRVFDSTVYTVTEEEMERLCYGAGSGGFVWGKLIAKDILKNSRFESGRIYEDSAITCQWYYAAGSFAETSSQLYLYYVNPAGTMRSKFSRKQLDILWSKNQQEAFYESVGYYHMQSVVVSSNVLSAARCYRALIDELHDRKEAGKVRRFLIKKYFKNRKLVSFTPNEKNYIMQMLHPKIMDFYWFATAQVKKFIK